MKNRLIVALDVPTLSEARAVVRKLKKGVSLFKIGLELFSAEGPDVVKMVRDEGGRVFLDLKFHDIPNTVGRACAAAASLGIFMLNVHASGGPEMMKAAARAVRSFSGGSLRASPEPPPILVGVTVLTSDPKRAKTSREVVRLAREARSAGLDGVVCSALEASKVRQACGNKFVIVTPGIRPSGADKGDQKRVATPALALKNGADYLVVGRPILQSSDPQRIASEILTEIQSSPV